MADVILVVGDMAGPTDRNEGSVATAALMTSLIAANPGAVVLVLGDNAYNDGNTEEYTKFYDPVWGAPQIASRVADDATRDARCNVASDR